MAVGHTLLVIVYQVLRKREAYRELGVDYYDRLQPERLTPTWSTGSNSSATRSRSKTGPQDNPQSNRSNFRAVQEVYSLVISIYPSSINPSQTKGVIIYIRCTRNTFDSRQIIIQMQKLTDAHQSFVLKNRMGNVTMESALCKWCWRTACADNQLTRSDMPIRRFVTSPPQCSQQSCRVMLAFSS